MNVPSWLAYHLGVDQPDIYRIEYFKYGSSPATTGKEGWTLRLPFKVRTGGTPAALKAPKSGQRASVTDSSESRINGHTNDVSWAYQ